jgi:hypothetical protein
MVMVMMKGQLTCSQAVRPGRLVKSTTFGGGLEVGGGRGEELNDVLDEDHLCVCVCEMRV